MRKIRDIDHKDLWDAYEETRAPEVKQKIIAAYFPLVKYLAERMSTTLPASVDTDDLISMGTFGLIEAIDRLKWDIAVPDPKRASSLFGSTCLILISFMKS